MDSKFHDDEDDNVLEFQDLRPQKPANAWQKSIINLQDNWPPQWNKRHLFILLTALSSLLIIFLIFELMHPSTQPDGIQDPVTNNTAKIADFVPYNNVIYILVSHTLDNYDQLEALNAKTGKLAWSYTHQNVVGIRLFGDILYIQTDTNLIALNANTRTQLWQNQSFSSNINWQVDQGVLFITATNGIITALNASTGAHLWETDQPSEFWQVDNGTVYMASSSGLGLSAVNAHSGRQLWYDTNIDPGSPANIENMSQELKINNGHIYIKNSKDQNIQALDGQDGTMLWQHDMHGTDFELAAQGDILLLSDAKKTQVEALNTLNGNLLWQHPGTIDSPLQEISNQTVISSAQKNEIEIIRTSDGTTLNHFSHKDTPFGGNQYEQLFSIENGIALFINYSLISHAYTNPKIVAMHISNGITIWSSAVIGPQPTLQNDTIDATIHDNTLLALRIDNGHVQWQYPVDTMGK